MGKVFQNCLLRVFCALFLFPAGILAQQYEIGVQFSGMHLHKIDEAPVGVGVRFHYNATPIIAADAEWMHYPENSAGNFGETSLLLGIRAGKQIGRFGIYGKARSGLMHFGGGYFSQRLDRKTHMIFDTGGVLDYYPSRRTFVRIDITDLVIYYGGARLFDRIQPYALGTVHNFQPGFGFGLRF